MAKVETMRQKHVQQLQKTQMCKFFEIHNRCARGSNCSFAHDPSEIREKPNLNCTSMCKVFLTNGFCPNANCGFAHDEKELRATKGFFKSKMCKFAGSGRCKHGAACRFAHAPEELKQSTREMQVELRNPQKPQPLALIESNLLGYKVPDAPEAPEVQGMVPSEILEAVQALKGRSSLALHQSLLQRAGRGRDGQSDESTAGTGSPDGSGDSGEEANMSWPEKCLRGVKARHCTTMMIINVPQFLTQGALISLLEDRSPSLRGTFDFFYLPWDDQQEQNLGYAIINFFESFGAEDFQNEWSDQVLDGGKRLRIITAALQGRAANVQHFSTFRLAHHHDLRFRPVVRAIPQAPLQPMPEVTTLRAFDL